MDMKTIAGILMLVILVTLVAVSGSRAQPLPASSVAFQQCLGQAALSDGRCTSAVGHVAGVDEFGGDRAMHQAGYGDLGHAQGGDLSSPEFWRDIGWPVIKAVILEVMRWALDRYFGGDSSADLTTEYASPIIFDPAK
jgi:hypothetical protein